MYDEFKRRCRMLFEYDYEINGGVKIQDKKKSKQHRKIFQRKRYNVFGELNMKNTKKLEQIESQIAKLQEQKKQRKIFEFTINKNCKIHPRSETVQS